MGKKGNKGMKKENEVIELVEESKLNIAPPWIQFANELVAMFGNDPEIQTDYNNDTVTFTLRVANSIKADALTKILPTEKEFGNVVLKINVVPANELETAATLYRNALNGNPAFAYVFPVEGVFTNPVTYVAFRRRIIQYYNDDLGDPHGNKTTLCQELAKDIFTKQDGVFFCTDTDGEKIGRELGTWPEKGEQ